MDLQKRIYALLIGVNDFPLKDKRDVLEFLEHDEWGVAFEVMCSVIEQENLSIDNERYKDIEEIGIHMEMDEELWTVLKPIK